MNSITATSTDLLNGLKDLNNSRVWNEFVTRYQPILVSFGKRLGLKEEDALDAAQDAMFQFARAYREGKYDRGKGRLRTWLSTIAANKVRDLQRRRKEVLLADQESAMYAINSIPDDRTMNELWEAEWRQAIITKCMNEVSSQVSKATMEAFKLFTLRSWPAEKVASHLGITRDSVYQAKRRVLARIQNLERYLEENW